MRTIGTGWALTHAFWSTFSHRVCTSKIVMNLEQRVNELDFFIAYGHKMLATDVDNLALEYVRDCGYLVISYKTTSTGDQLIALMNFTAYQK